MKLPVLYAALLATACGVALAAPAIAQTAQPAQPTQSTSAPAPRPANAQAVTKKPEDARYGTRMCVRDTGSLIKPPKGQCLPVNGNTYSARDLQRTGYTDVARALQQLDPSVTVGH